MVRATLERHPLVEACWDAPESHLGATVATLRVSTAPAEGTEGTDSQTEERG
jgi:hypothetical protein